MLGIGLSLIDSTDNIGTVFNRLLGVESSLHKFQINGITYVFTGHTLNKDLGVLVNEYVWLSLFGIETS